MSRETIVSITLESSSFKGHETKKKLVVFSDGSQMKVGEKAKAFGSLSVPGEYDIERDVTSADFGSKPYIKSARLVKAGAASLSAPQAPYQSAVAQKAGIDDRQKSITMLSCLSTAAASIKDIENLTPEYVFNFGRKLYELHEDYFGRPIVSKKETVVDDETAQEDVQF
jgi:hypothetical protein